MFTVKIRAQVWERTMTTETFSSATGPSPVQTIDSLFNETLHFIPADRIEVNGTPGSSVELDAWGAGEYHEMRSSRIDRTPAGDPDVSFLPESRFITVYHDGDVTFYAASQAWLLGPNGDTIERIAP